MESNEICKTAQGDEAAPGEKDTSGMDELITAAGTTGWINYLIFFFCSFASFVSPMHSVSYQFLGATPDYWCRVEELRQANWTTEEIKNFTISVNQSSSSAVCEIYDYNYTLAAELGYESSLVLDIFDKNAPLIPCSTREFDPLAPLTVVSKWDLVCDRRALYSTTQAAVQAGKLIGSLTMGYLVEIFGRRSLLLWTGPLYFLIGIVTAFSPNLTIYILLKLVTSGISMVFYLAGVVLCFELCSTSQRSYLGALSALPWALGYMVCPGIAYYIRPFQYLQIACTLPVLTQLPNYWVIPESPRWLVLRERYQEAIEVLKKIAKYNKRDLPTDKRMLQIMTDVYQQQQSLKASKKSKHFQLNKFFELWLLKGWRWQLPVLSYGWIAGAMVYYGVSLNPPNLSTGKYLYIFLGGLLEIPSYLILWPVNKYIGRKKGLIILYMTCAVSIYGAMVVSIVLADETMTSFAENLMMYFALLGKFAITSGYQLVWMYTVEFLPTEHRSIVTGETSVLARFGSMASPYIVDLLGESYKWAPLAIFGSVAVVAGLLLGLLPETREKTLEDSPQEGKKNPQEGKNNQKEGKKIPQEGKKNPQEGEKKRETESML